MVNLDSNPRHKKDMDYCTKYIERSALDHSATGSYIAVGAFNCLNTRPDRTHIYMYFTCYARLYLDTCVYHVIHQSTWGYYCLFGVDGKLPTSLKKTDLSNLWKYHIPSSFFSFFASDCTRFIPLFTLLWGVSTTCLYIVFILINK